MTHELAREAVIPRPISEVFPFFEDPRNLARLTPREMNFSIKGMDPLPVRPGFRIDYEIRWLGVPIRWRITITEYDPGVRFVDVQTKGPYASWEHEHTFEEVDDRTVMRDRVRYRMPFGILGSIAHRLIIRRQLEHIFDYRLRRIRRMYPAESPVPDAA